MNPTKIIVSVLSGVAVGALLGVLFAPAKGSETRGKISKTGKDLSHAVKEKYTDILETVSGPFMRSKGKVSGNGSPEAVRTGAA
jgi:gas vesicle protein